MSQNYTSPLGLVVIGSNNPDLAAVKAAIAPDGWKQPNAGLKFTLQKACYTDGTSVITMSDSNGQPVTGEFELVAMGFTALSQLRNVYKLIGRIKGQPTLNGQPIPLAPAGANSATLKMSDAISIDSHGLTADTYAELVYDADAKIGAVLVYDNGLSRVKMLETKKLTGIDATSGLPLPPSSHGRIEDTPLTHLNNGAGQPQSGNNSTP